MDGCPTRGHLIVRILQWYWAGIAGIDAYLLGLLVGVAATLSLVKSSWYLKLYQAKAGIVVSGVSLLVSIGVVELALRLVDPLGISYYELTGNYVRDKLADDQLIFRHKLLWETRYGNVRVTYGRSDLFKVPTNNQLSSPCFEYQLIKIRN